MARFLSAPAPWADHALPQDGVHRGLACWPTPGACPIRSRMGQSFSRQKAEFANSFRFSRPRDQAWASLRRPDRVLQEQARLTDVLATSSEVPSSVLDSTTPSGPDQDDGPRRNPPCLRASNIRACVWAPVWMQFLKELKTKIYPHGRKPIRPWTAKVHHPQASLEAATRLSKEHILQSFGPSPSQ
jgi:hypothetical protein